MRYDRSGQGAGRILLVFQVSLAIVLGCIFLGDWASRSSARPPRAPKYRKTIFASGLNFPYGMQILPDGSLLIGVSNPTPGGNLFSSTGALIRLVDANGDGQADGPGTLLCDGLPGTLTAVSTAGTLVAVTSSQAGSERISLLRMGANPGDAFTLLGSLNFGFPPGWEHTTYGSVMRGTAGQYELFFNVGSESNFAATVDTVSLSGLITGTASGDSIYRVSIQDTGVGVPVVSGLTQIATGLRNAAGMAFHPTTGDFYFTDNGIDGLVNPDEPLSADELNRIAAADIGGSPEDFGFPNNYIEYRTGTFVGGGGVPPVVAFQPIPDPQTGSESEGPAQFAFSPADDGIFVGFHGRFNLAGVANEENPLVHYSLATGTYTDFVSNDDPSVGHLDGLLSSGKTLFVADLTSGGNTGGAGGDGVIYLFRFR